MPTTIQEVNAVLAAAYDFDIISIEHVGMGLDFFFDNQDIAKNALAIIKLFFNEKNLDRHGLDYATLRKNKTIANLFRFTLMQTQLAELAEIQGVELPQGAVNFMAAIVDSSDEDAEAKDELSGAAEELRLLLAVSCESISRRATEWTLVIDETAVVGFKTIIEEFDIEVQREISHNDMVGIVVDAASMNDIEAKYEISLQARTMSTTLSANPTGTFAGSAAAASLNLAQAALSSVSSSSSAASSYDTQLGDNSSKQAFEMS